MASNSVEQRIAELAPRISRAARDHGLDAALLAGLAAQESLGVTWAMRHEPAYRWLVEDAPRPRLMSAASERYGQMTSWGLCQVMGAVAREHGFAGWFSELCRPSLGLDMGARHLAHCLRRRGGDLGRGLLRYNGGGDPAYPDKVLARAAGLAHIFGGGPC